MDNYLKMAEMVGRNVGAMLEPLKAKLAEQQKQLEAMPTQLTLDEVAAQFERRFSDLALSWERQAREVFEKAADKMPIPKDGKDGLPAEAISIEQNEREITITVGATVKTIVLDTVLDRGVWKEGDYQKGDAVTYGGSLWIAQEATSDAPSTSKAWRLAVKKGRDGKDLRDTASKHDKSKGVEL